MSTAAGIRSTSSLQAMIELSNCGLTRVLVDSEINILASSYTLFTLFWAGYFNVKFLNESQYIRQCIGDRVFCFNNAVKFIEHLNL